MVKTAQAVRKFLIAKTVNFLLYFFCYLAASLFIIPADKTPRLISKVGVFGVFFLGFSLSRVGGDVLILN